MLWASSLFISVNSHNKSASINSLSTLILHGINLSHPLQGEQSLKWKDNGPAYWRCAMSFVPSLSLSLLTDRLPFHCCFLSVPLYISPSLTPLLHALCFRKRFQNIYLFGPIFFLDMTLNCVHHQCSLQKVPKLFCRKSKLKFKCELKAGFESKFHLQSSDWHTFLWNMNELRVSPLDCGSNYAQLENTLISWFHLACANWWLSREICSY